MKLKHLGIALFALLPLLASAHVGSDAGLHHGMAFVIGLLHPFTGVDHLAAMLAVGMWSALAFQHAQGKMWAVPIAFAAVLLVGGLMGVTGVSLPAVEPMIAASLLVLGLLVASRVQLPVAAGMALVGVFALFHGIAHGSELPAARAVAALAGMMLGTMTLHVIGMLLGHFVLRRAQWLPRVTGGAVALLGIGLLSGAF